MLNVVKIASGANFYSSFPTHCYFDRSLKTEIAAEWLIVFKLPAIIFKLLINWHFWHSALTSNFSADYITQAYNYLRKSIAPFSFITSFHFIFFYFVCLFFFTIIFFFFCYIIRKLDLIYASKRWKYAEEDLLHFFLIHSLNLSSSAADNKNLIEINLQVVKCSTLEIGWNFFMMHFKKNCIVYVTSSNKNGHHPKMNTNKRDRQSTSKSYQGANISYAVLTTAHQRTTSFLLNWLFFSHSYEQTKSIN